MSSCASAQIDLDKISDAAKALMGRENKMWNAYAAASALLYAILAAMHLVRIINRWSVVIGPYTVSTNVSWVALVVGGLLSIWGFMQLS